MMHNYKKIKWMFFALVAFGLAVSACIFSKFVSAMPQKEMTSLDAMPARVLVSGGQEVFVRPALKSFPESNEQKFKDTFDNAIISSQTDQYRKDQLFIRFKEGTGLCVVATDLIKDKKKFEQVTGTKNLDILNETYAVQELKPLINSDSLASRQHFVGSISSHLAKSIEQKQKQQIADSIKEMNTRYPKRSRHAVPDLQAHLAAKLTNTFIMVFNSEKVTIGEVKAAYENDPNVESVEFISKAYIYYEPTDPYYSSTGTWGNVYRDMYGLTPDFMHAGDPIATQGAWAKSKGDGVIIAVIDTGVDYAHPDIKANMWQNKSGHYGYDFVSDDTDPMDDQGHGTHCAGTIAAAENGLGVIGVAPLSKIMALKGLDSQGNGYDDDLASAVFYAVENGADITSSS